MNKKDFDEFTEVFEYLEKSKHGWEKLTIEDKVKIKTNQTEVNFDLVSEFLKKFNLKITDISFTDYYGIVIGVKKLPIN